MMLFRDKILAKIILFIFISLIANGYSAGYSHPNKLFLIHYDNSMPRNNIALIIPGKNQTYSDPGYDSIGCYYERKGITPIFVNIVWDNVGFGKLSTAALQIDTMLTDSFPDSRVFLFGFSFGAVITFKVSQLINAGQVLLCSMSPVFAEDRSFQIFPFKQLLGFFTDYSSNGLTYSDKQGGCVFFLYGDHDSFLINDAIINNRKSSYKCNKTIIVKNARHNISGQSYLQAINSIVQRINK